MTIAPLLLDQLEWRAMVDTIRSRIAAVSGEQWTLHAPVDPGVTLLELFAHQLEQRSYWLDQVPDALINGLVALLGAEPRPARAATTVLTVGDVPLLPADTVMRVAGGDPGMVMATLDALAVLPVERIDLATRYGTRSITPGPARLWPMQPLCLLPADGGEGEAEITLWLVAPPPQGTACAGLLLELDAPHSVVNGWHPDAPEAVPPPASLAWHYSVDASGGTAVFPGAALFDGTQGLRRSGLLRFDIPADWAPSGPISGGLTPYRLTLRCAACTASAPPELRRMIPNAVAAHHSVPVTVDPLDFADQLSQWLPLPGRTLALTHPLPPLEPSVALALRGRDEVWREWRVVRDFARFGPEDPVLLVNRAYNRIDFADGLTGRLPVPSRNSPLPLTLTYRAGGGALGNLGANLAWECDAPFATAVNPVAAQGWRESETAEQMRDRIGVEIFECHRAVTLADYEALAVATPGLGVGRAKALAGVHPGFPCLSIPGAVSVTIVPEVPRQDDWLHGPRRVNRPQPDPGMLAAVRAALDNARLLTAEVYVAGPSYRAIEIEVALSGSPRDVAASNALLTDGLQLFLDPLVGGAKGNGWPFGHPVRPSELAHCLQQLAGDDAVVERVMVRFAGSDSDLEECADLTIGPAELVALGSLRLRWSLPSNPAGGFS
ncbi:MAG: baseplate J/gp47 family protein [Novosphingobium sp.]